MQCALYFVFVVSAVEPHCVFRGGANYNIAPPDRTSAEQAHSQHQPNLDFTTLQRDKATLEIRLEQQQQDLANTLSTLRSCQKLTTCA